MSYVIRCSDDGASKPVNPVSGDNRHKKILQPPGWRVVNTLNKPAILDYSFEPPTAF